MNATIARNNVTPLFVDRTTAPQSLEAEEAILGGILLDGNALARVREILHPDAFYLPANKDIYQAFLALDRKGSPIDLMTVSAELSANRKKWEALGGSAKLAQLVDRTVSSLNIQQYAELVQEKFIRRQAIAIAHEVIDAAYGAALTDLSEVIKEKFTAVTGSPLVTGTEKSLKLHKCDRLLQKLTNIQLNVDSPTYKEFLLQELAKETGRSPQQLQSLFYKSLIEDEWEPTLTLSQLREKYGDQVREWLLHGFIPKGVTTLIHALGGQGKTKLMYDFIYSLALGEPWQGFPVTKKAKILIIQTDEQPTDMLASLEIRGIRPDDPRFDIHYKTRWSTEHIPQLYQEVQNERYDLILIDSLASVSRFSTVSENDAEFAKPILLLNKIAADFNCAIILVHHSSKSGDARGTTAVYNAVSQVFQLSKPENDYLPDSTNRILMVQKSRARRPAKYSLSLNPEDGSWTFAGEDTPTPDMDAPLKEQIIDFLSQHRGLRFCNEDLSHAINYNAPSVRKVTHALAADGIISWQKQGRTKIYWLDPIEQTVNVTKSQYDPASDPLDRIVDRKMDRIQKPVTAIDTGLCDPAIHQNQKISEKKSSKKSKNVDRWIAKDSVKAETVTVQESQNCKVCDPPCDPSSDPVNRVDRMDRQTEQPEIKKGDRLTLRKGCEILIHGDQVVPAGTVIEVITMGLAGTYKNQIQGRILGDNSAAFWVPIANVEPMQVSKEAHHE